MNLPHFILFRGEEINNLLYSALLLFYHGIHVSYRSTSEDPVQVVEVDAGSSYHFVNAYEHSENGKTHVVVGKYYYPFQVIE